LLTAATSEVARLAGLFVRRIDAGLVESAVRNAQSGVEAHQLRHAEADRTLDELLALESRLAG
jgi:hypothetical protein